jgi:hypothetical protein
MPHKFIVDLGMHWATAKFVLRPFLTDYQKLRFSICENLFQMSLSVKKHEFMVMTLKPNNNPHTGRILLCLAPRSMTGVLISESSAACFFDRWGIVLYELARESQTIRIFIL